VTALSGIVTVNHSSIHVRNTNNGFRRERKGSITLPRGNPPSSTLNVHTYRTLDERVKKKGKGNRGKSTSFSQTNKRKKKKKEKMNRVKKLSGTRCTKREPKEKKQKQKHRPSQPGTQQFPSQMPSPASLCTCRTPFSALSKV
jgi:hypothetical protein